MQVFQIALFTVLFVAAAHAGFAGYVGAPAHHAVDYYVGHASHPAPVVAAPYGHGHGGYSSGGAFGYYG
ncbi:hypothetical protein C0J52_05129 [Blattella germanica]|nr:hypothetical protein C0J52_05129 [Blattella germanica]